MEPEGRLRGKGFETDEFERLEIHGKRVVVGGGARVGFIF
jgi:hypothetical protein